MKLKKDEEIKGLKALVESQRETIANLTKKLNGNEPINCMIKILAEIDGVIESFYLEKEYSPVQIEAVKDIINAIEYYTGFKMIIYKNMEEEEKINE